VISNLCSEVFFGEVIHRQGKTKEEMQEEKKIQTFNEREALKNLKN